MFDRDRIVKRVFSRLEEGGKGMSSGLKSGREKEEESEKKR